MLATFLVSSHITILGDDTNIALAGRMAFQWESWSADGLLHKEPLYQSATPFKQSEGNVDRLLGFRIGQTLASVSAASTFLKTVDALVLQQGTLTLQPDATVASFMTYANAILKSARLVPGPDVSVGKRITMSYAFECSTVT